MNAILFGNGLNMITKGNVSWGELVSVIEEDKNEERIPFTLQYEAKLADSDILSQEVNKDFLIDIKKKLKDYSTNEIYQRMGSLNVEHFMTTNYDFVMRNTLVALGHGKPKKERGDKYSIRGKIFFEKPQEETAIWHIHGNIDALSTIMLGLGYYGSKIARMKDYIDGKCDYGPAANKIRIGPLKTRLQAGVSNPVSWIDLFFIADIHIIGYGFQYDEIDLWWLLTKRKEIFEDKRLKGKQNKITFYGKADKGKTELFNKLGVDVVDYKTSPKTTEAYIKMYNSFLDKIAETIRT